MEIILGYKDVEIYLNKYDEVIRTVGINNYDNLYVNSKYKKKVFIRPYYDYEQSYMAVALHKDVYYYIDGESIGSLPFLFITEDLLLTNLNLLDEI